MSVCSIFRPELFYGKVAIVTGGGSGIGKAIASELSHLGAKIVIASRNEEKLQHAVKEISPNGKNIKVVRCNIRDPEQVKNMVDTTLSSFGKLDFLVNNGGGQFTSPVAQMKTKGWLAVIDTNLNGTFNCCKQAHHSWMKENGGVIVNITALVKNGFPNFAHTSAARAGVENLSKTLALEWASNGIRINCVAPGAIFSETAKANYSNHPDLFEKAAKSNPAQRLGTPEEVSSAVCYLLSPAASYISGSTITVHGGGDHWWKVDTYEEHDKSIPFTWTKSSL